jgi:hypothetical protein
MMLSAAVVEKMIDGLSELKDDWDSYGGKSPTREALASARKCLSSIHVAPMSDGGLQIDLGNAEVVIAPDGKVVES